MRNVIIIRCQIDRILCYESTLKVFMFYIYAFINRDTDFSFCTMTIVVYYVKGRNF